MKSDVFISHSHRDAEVACALRSAFEAKGIKCWVCSLDIPAGEGWAGDIVKAVDNCCVFVYILSRNSCESEECFKEIGLANSTGCRMICLKIDDAELQSDARYHLANKQMLFADRAQILADAQRVAQDILCPTYDSTVRGYTLHLRLDGDNLCEPLSKKQRLELTEMLVKIREELTVRVEISDENVEIFEERCRKWKESDEELTDEQQREWALMVRYCSEHRQRLRLRECALELFFKDADVREACRLDTDISHAWKVIKAIAEGPDCIPYTDERYMYPRIEFFIRGAMGSFAVPVEVKMLSYYREHLDGLFEFGARTVIDFAFDPRLWREALPYFYMHLARKVDRKELTPGDGNKEWDFFAYYCGMK